MLLKKPKKGKKGSRGKCQEHLADDLVDIILDNDKYKEKLLLTNVKKVENGQYYDKVIEELKERNPVQTRLKFKRCINICRDSVMKVKHHLVLNVSRRISSWEVGLINCYLL